MIPKKFETIKQPWNSRVCVACVAAMVVGRGLKYAQNRMVPNRQGIYTTEELIKFLGAHNIAYGILLHPKVPGARYSGHKQMNIKFPWHNNPAILSVYNGSSDVNHAVFWDGKYVRDPFPYVPDTMDLSSYRILDINFITYLR